MGRGKIGRQAYHLYFEMMGYSSEERELRENAERKKNHADQYLFFLLLVLLG